MNVSTFIFKVKPKVTLSSQRSTVTGGARPGCTAWVKTF